MISKHVACHTEHDNYARLANYIADAGHEGEKCLASWCAGCAADDDYELAVMEVEATQDLNTRSAKEKTYHLLVSFRPEDEAKLTSEACKAIEERFATVLGYSEHQRHCGIHKNTNNIHMHIAYNMIHPERLTRHEPFRDYKARDKLCRELEQEYGIMVDNGREQARENALTSKAATIEAQTGQESFESYAKRHKAEILKTLEHAKDWQALHEGLKAFGLGVKPHTNGLVIHDLHGKQANHALKASAVDRSFSAKCLQDRFGEYRPYRNLRQVQEVSRYQAAPLHRSPERGQLSAKYKAGIETRKTKLEAIKIEEDKQLSAIRQQWTAKRQGIEQMNIAKRNRQNLLALAKKREAEAMAKTRLEYAPQREAVRQEVPFTSWSGFLRLEAESGNETALAVLRSRTEAVEPEQALKLAQDAPKAPVKDWSTHGLDYTVKAALKAEYAEKESTLQERGDISASGKKQLQAFLRMEQTAAEASAAGQDLGKITRRIDGKGIVIFTLESGGSIRDTGKELFFSSYDEKARQVAVLYAGKKWGKHLAVEKGHITFQAERQREGWTPEPELPQKQKGLSR